MCRIERYMWSFICSKLLKKEDGSDTTVYIRFTFFLHCNTPGFYLDNESDLKTYPKIGQAAFDATRRIFFVKGLFFSKDYKSIFIVKVVKVRKHNVVSLLDFEQMEQLKS